MSRFPKQINRLFSLLLVVIMLVGMLPVSALAATASNATAFENGKDYLIVSNSNALSYTGNALGKVAYTDSTEITAAIRWTAEASGNGFKLKNGSTYLSIGGSFGRRSLSTTNDADSAAVWTYNASNNALTTTVNNFSYYLFCSGSGSSANFTINYNVGNNKTSLYLVTDSTSGGTEQPGEGGEEPEQPAASFTYELDTNGIDSGAKYLIVAQNTGKALSAAARDNNSVNVTINRDNTITMESDAYDWIFTSSSGSYTIQLEGGNYLGRSSSSLSSGNSNTKWSASGNNGTYNISIRSGGSSYYLRWNNNKFDVNTSRNSVRLFKLVEKAPVHVHAPEKVVGQAPTCNEAGWMDYYQCQCTACFTDAAGEHEIENLNNWKAGDGKVDPRHTPVPVSGQAPTCSEAGWMDYYQCQCGAYFSDAAGEHEFTDLAAWKADEGKVNKLAHTPEKVDGQAPTCGKSGWNDYYQCQCGAYFSDAAGEHEIENLNNWKTGAGFVPATNNHVDGDDKNHDCDNCDATDIEECTPADPVEENKIEATCINYGFYLSVVYCSECDKRMSYEAKAIEPTGIHVDGEDEDHDCDTKGCNATNIEEHTLAEDVTDKVDATCGKDGSYNTVVYCTECGETISSTPTVIPATGEHVDSDDKDHNCDICGATDIEEHSPADPVEENKIEPTCINYGYCRSVVYCTECDKQLTVSLVAFEPTGIHVDGDDKDHNCDYCTETEIEEHAPAAPVVEDKIDVTCGQDGSYNTVVYCSECGEKLSSETTTTPATGKHVDGDDKNHDCDNCDATNIEKHTPAAPVVEDKIDATCGTDGSYNTVVYCSECGEKLSSTPTAIPATGKHIDGDDKNHDCDNCDKTNIEGHTAAEPVIEDRVEAVCGTNGSYNTVIYCSECGEKLNSTPTVIPATGKHKDGDDDNHNCDKCGALDIEQHALGAAREENRIEPTCGNDGSYNIVKYCVECGEKVLIETKIIPATGKHVDGDDDNHSCDKCDTEFEKHALGAAREEDRVEPTCKDGSYNIVKYCVECGEKVLIETKTIPAISKHVDGNDKDHNCDNCDTLNVEEHTLGAAKEEDRIEATCGKNGSYNTVKYCTECGEKVESVPHTIPATGKHVDSEDKDHNCNNCGALNIEQHTPGAAKEEDRIEAAIGKPGSYNSVVYCTECDEKISSEFVVIPATGYTYVLDTDGIDRGAKYLIVAENTGKALSKAANSNNSVNVTINGNTIIMESDAYDWTFTSSGNSYTIRLDGGDYLGRGNNGGIAAGNSNTTWSVAKNWNSNTFNITQSTGSWMSTTYYYVRWNNNAFQASSSSGSVRLYKLVHTHTPARVSGQEATCVDAGCKDYYQCQDTACRKYFSDAACQNEITNLNSWKNSAGLISATGQHSYVNGKCEHCNATVQLLGDADGNNIINTNDAKMILRSVVNPINARSVMNTSSYDVDGNGKVDTNDAKIVLQYCANIITSFPAAQADN